MPDTPDPYLVRKSPREVVLSVARGDNIPDDVADDFLKVTGGIESGSSHYWRNGKVKTSPVDPKDGQRAIGFSQIKPATARSVGVTDPYNETENIKAGLRYFAKGGNDPVRRRIAYFSGTNSKAAQYYDRTGKIPSGGDFTGTSFKKYVAASGGLQNAPQDPYLVLKQQSSVSTADPYLVPKAGTGMPAATETPKAVSFSTNDTQWHFGEYIAKPSRQALKVLRDAVAEDVRKKAAGQAIAPPPPEYQAEMRKRAGLKPLPPKPVPMSSNIQQTLGLGRPLYETLSEQGIAKAGQRDSIRPEIERQVRSDLRQRQAKEKAVPAGIISNERIWSPEQLRTEADIQREVDNRTREAVSETQWHEQNKAEVDRLTPEYRKVIRANVGAVAGQTKWTAETMAQGGAGIIDFLAGAVKGGGKATGLLTENAEATDSGANQMRVHAEALRRAALEEGADRNKASKFVQEIVGGFIASAPEFAAMGLGVPAPITFAAGSGTRAYGTGKPVAPAVLHGAATGAAFELPIKGALPRGAAVGATTTGIDLASGASPKEALQSGLVNAAMSASGGRRDAKTNVAPMVETESQRASLDAGLRSPTAPGEPRARLRNATTDIEEINARQRNQQIEQLLDQSKPLPDTVAPQRFQHLQFGEIEVLPDQSNAGRGRIKVAEVSDRSKVHYVRRSDMQGRGNARMIPIKPEESTSANLPTSEVGRADAARENLSNYKTPEGRDRMTGSIRDRLRDDLNQVTPEDMAELEREMPRPTPLAKLKADESPEVSPSEGDRFTRHAESPAKVLSPVHPSHQGEVVKPKSEVGQAGKELTAPLSREGIAVRQFTRKEGELTPAEKAGTVSPPFKMSRAELEEAHRQAKASEETLEVEILGEDGARRWRELNRQMDTAESHSHESSREDVARIRHQMDELTKNVSPEQLAQWEDESRRSSDEYKGYIDDLDAIAAHSDSEQSLARALVKPLTRFRIDVDPANMTSGEQRAYAQLRYAAEIAKQQGLDPQRIRDLTLAEVSHVYGKENMGLMLGNFFKSAVEKNVERLSERGTSARSQPKSLEKSELKGEPKLAPTKVESGAKEPKSASSDVAGGEKPPSTPVIKLKPRKGQRSFPETVKQAGYEAKSSTYDVLPNVETVAKANDTIKAKGVDLAVAELSSRKGEFSPEDVAVGSRAIQEYEKSGQMDKAIETVETLAENLTKAGQTVQAASIIARLSPEGTLLYAQRRLPKGEKLDVKQGEMLVAKSKEVRMAENQLAAKDREMTIPQLRARLRELEGQAKTVKKAGKSSRAKVEGFQARMLRMEAEARASLLARTEQAKLELKGPKGQRGSSVNPAAVAADIADWTKIGAAKIARGGVDFAQWSKSMLDEFGEAIKPHLNKIFIASRDMAKEEKIRAKTASQTRGSEKRLTNVGELVTPEAVRKEIANRLELQKKAQKANRELQQMYDHLSRTKTQKATDALTGLRRANLLTAAKTHLRNITSNITFQGTEALSRPLAAVGDMIAKRAKSTGIRTTAAIDIPAEARAILDAIVKEGPRRAADIILGREVLPLEGYGKQKESIGSKMQLGSSDTGIKLLDGYINTVFRSMEAEDAVFKVYAFGRELADIAKSQAITERGRDKSVNVTRRTKEMRQNPTDAMLMEAAAYADYATFQNDNTVSRVIRSGKRMIGPVGKFAVETIALFDRTPTNILYRAFENSPLGFISAAKKFHNIGNIKGKELSGLPTARAQKGVADAVADAAFTRAEQKDFARTFGRASTGTLLAGLALILAHKGLLSGSSDYNDDKGDYMKKRKEVGGGGMLRVPGTNQRIYIGDTPVGKAMVTVAAMYEQATKEKKDDETDADLRDRKITGAAKSAGRLALNQPLLQGTRDLFSGRSLSESAGNYVGSLIPGSSALTQIGEITDPEARKTYGEGFAAQIKKVSPYHRRSLSINAGVNKGERGGLGRRILRGLDPFNTTTEGKGATSIKLKPRTSKSAFQF